MNVNLTSFQSVFNNYNVYQLVLKPIILTVAAVALAIFTVALVSSCLSRRRTPPQTTPPRYNPTTATTRNNPPTTNRYNPPTTTATTTTRYNSNYQTTTPTNQFHSLLPGQRPMTTTVSSSNRSSNQSSLPTQPKQPASTPPPERYEGGTYQVTVEKNNISNGIPYDIFFNLEQEITRRGVGMNITVHFIGERGSDSGGLRRQYFSELFESLKTNCSVRQGLHGPESSPFTYYVAKNGLHLLVPQEKAYEDQNLSLFYLIGCAMGYVYFNNEILTGTVFHEAFFNAILCLSDEEIELPYEHLPCAAKIRICKTLMQTMTDLNEDNFGSYIPLLTFLEKGDQFTEEDLTDRLKAYYSCKLFDEEERTNGPRDRFLKETIRNEFEPRVNIKAIMADKRGFYEACLNLLKHIFEPEKPFGCLGTPELAFFPIHSMAKGMKSVADKANVTVGGRTVKGTRWPEIRGLAPSQVTGASTASIEVSGQALRSKIQGVLDRQVMCDSIVFPNDEDNEVVKNQVKWIKSWIMKETTTLIQIEQLLKFWTGSNAMTKTTRLVVNGVYEKTYPDPATCFNQLNVAQTVFGDEHSPFRNDTESNFHLILDDIVNTGQADKFTRL
jgi:hypothetical protein